MVRCAPGTGCDDVNNAVMLSIRPEWCARIAFNEQTVEVRKTRPKIEPPFKCYIYETKSESEIPWVDEDGHFIYKGRGAVIGEFVCDTIFNLSVRYSDPTSEIAIQGFPYTGMTDREIMGYLGNGKPGYGWHISNLVIYDTPRPLSDFGLKRPPQSWCYVQEM